jgi:hypothetical protein
LRVLGASGQTANLQQWENGGVVQAFVSPFGSVAFGTAGTIYSARLSVNTGTATTIGAVVRGAASQTANLTEWQDSSGTSLARINSAGSFIAPFSFIGPSASAISSVNIGVIPSSASNSGIIVRGAASQTADLQQWQNSAGTVKAKINSAGDLTAPSVNATWSMASYAGSASVVPIFIQGAASQTASLQEWKNSSGTVLANVSAGGSLISQSGRLIAGGAAGAGRLDIQTSSTTQVASTIRGSASQTADLTQWQDSTQAVLAKVDSAGNLTAASIIKSGGTSSQFLKADGSVDSSTYLTTEYSLPIATDTVLGGVKIGTNVSIDGSGVISVPRFDSLSFGVSAPTGFTTSSSSSVSTTGTSTSLSLSSGFGLDTGYSLLNSNSDQTIAGNKNFTGDVSTSGTFRLSNSNDVSLASTNHPFQIGASNSLNLRIDNNEIQVASNGVANTLALQSDGGTVSIGGGTTADLTVSGTISTQGKRIFIQSGTPASPVAGDVWIWY